MPKLSPALRRQLATTPEGHPVEVVVEVGQRAAGTAKPVPTGDRSQKIAALKEEFSASAEPIERAIEQSGGQILGRVWLNQSLKACLPREAVEALGEREDVERVDTPRIPSPTMHTTRRQALAGAAALAFAGALPRSLAAAKTSQEPARTVRPGRLRPGDVVGLVDPASAIWEPMNVEIVEESLAALGFKTKRGANLLARRGYFAGTDEQRAADVNAMFADPQVRAIHCVRGGWGSARLLPLLDWPMIAKNPKILLGYSDITALLLSLHAKTGLVTFHGPVGMSQWNPLNVSYLKRVLQDGEAVAFENLKEIDEDNLTVVENRIQTLHPGTARGRLLGGNLTVLTSIIGSGYLPDFEGCILFLEDVEEAPYRIDRMLTQLRLAGILQKARAVIWGHCSDCDPGEGFGSLTVAEVLEDHIRPLGVPAWRGAMFGHIERQFTLPVGAEVEVDAGAGVVRLIEPAVV